jgi:flagellar protein FlaG
MLIQNISSAASAPGLTSDSASVPAAAKSTPAPVDLPQVAVKTAATQPSPDQLKSAVDSANDAMKQNNSNVEFSIDQSTKQTVIKVMDSQSGQLITQFPSKDALAISQMIAESQSGALVRQKA